MTHSTVAIVGAGINGILLAYELTSRGYEVTMFEKGLEQPSATENFARVTNLLRPSRPGTSTEMRRIEQTGEEFSPSLAAESRIQVGGKAADWEAITLRQRPNDFQIGTRYGRGIDWALSYDDLEPYYGRAEAYMGVSGTDDDNPFASPRSTPYPLPPFELGYAETQLQQQLAASGIVTHTTPQARTREAYDGRPACQNFGICGYCPIGARYSPTHHLNLARQTGLLTLETNTSVRKIITEGNRASALLVQANDASEPREHSANLIILASGAIQGTRLLLLSANDQHPDGLGNHSGHLGKHIYYHTLRPARISLPQPYVFARTGFWTAQSEQHTDHSERGQYGGIKVEFLTKSASGGVFPVTPNTPITPTSDNIEAQLQAIRDDAINNPNTLVLTIHAESDMTANKFLTLSETVDPLGDPVPKVNYPLSEFDAATYEFGRDILDQYATALNAQGSSYAPRENWVTGNHHMGGTRMSATEADGVTDIYGKVHGIDNLFVTGASNFANTSAINPTLTLTALAFYTLDYLLDQQLDPI